MAQSNSNLTNNTSVIPVETVPYQSGASSPGQSAILYRQQQIAKQSAMNKSGGKRRRRKYHGGALIVPSFNTPGPPVSSGGQSATGASMSANTALSQGSANSVCDKCIGEASNTPLCQGPQCNPQAGGTGKQRGGDCGSGGLILNGQPWGCLSGGKKSKKAHKY